MRILYVGLLWPGGTCRQRMVALQQLGHEVVGVDTTPPDTRQQHCLAVRLLTRLGHIPDLANANRKIIGRMANESYDLLWVDRGLTVASHTLQSVKRQWPACRLVSYSPDDMLNPRNQSRRYLRCLRLYDVHVTTKSYNVAELKALGARDVLFVAKGYDPNTHRPMALTSAERVIWACDVGFVGDFEPPRYQMVLELARTAVTVTVRGPGWGRCAGKHSGLAIKPGWVLGDDYARVISATKISLCFLRKANRDLHTARSIEIPACGSFMLGERTNEHLALFEEGKEAEFFGSRDELIEKTRHYLSHDKERWRIAAAGRERCLRSGYSNHERLRAVLSHVFPGNADTSQRLPLTVRYL